MLHDVSHYLTAKFKLITIENLNVKGMVKNHKLARAISDAGFGMLHNLTLSDREWQCPKYKTTHDRDRNASWNLDDFGRDTLQLDFKTYARAT